MRVLPILFNTEMVRAIQDGRKSVTRRVVKNPYVWHRTKRPYNPGDILYVRETWGFDKHNWLYKADFSVEDLERMKHLLRWHPSIHMPRKAARIFLRVTDVRVERLQDMTENDVFAEGAGKLCGCPNEHTIYYPEGGTEACYNTNWCKAEFCPILKSYPELFGERVWDSTIKAVDLDRYGWAANPWVWVIEFEQYDRPKDF